MVDRFLFKDRDGRTPLTTDLKKDLNVTSRSHRPFSRRPPDNSSVFKRQWTNKSNLAEAICKFENIQIPTWGRNLKADAKTHRNIYIAAVTKARRTKDFNDLIKFMFE